MPTTNSTALSRYRPAILVITGAAAAYAAYLIYSSVLSQDSTSTEKSLHRSNAVRRPNSRPRRPRTTRLVSQLLAEGQPLGPFEFFGNRIELDARYVLSAEELHEIASRSQPSASPEQVDYQIAQLYDTFLDRILTTNFSAGPLSGSETHVVSQWLLTLVPSQELITQAIERHAGSFGNGNADAMDVLDVLDGLGDRESLPPTEVAWHSDESSDNGTLDVQGQTLQRTLYHIAEDRARQEGVIHRGITCNGCDTKPIRGVRWHCANCNDFDLCSDCKATNSHIKTHVFYEIRIPVPNLGLPKQEPLYPGRPHLMSLSVNSALKKRLVEETKKELEEIEALWDTFTCLASVEWDEDPNKIGWALDRRAFNQAFIPRYSSFMAAPNLVYDRIFAYYDSDRNGRIGFEEFVKGLAGLHSHDKEVKFRIVFDGYDIDGDGFISRKDVLRIFRAFYAIEKEATQNYLSETAEELSILGAFDTIHSSQPLGSAFSRNGIPDPRPHQRHNKTSDDAPDAGDVLQEDADDTEDREHVISFTAPTLSLNQNRPNMTGQQAVEDRWARRQFYIDEEEGFHTPAGADADADADDGDVFEMEEDQAQAEDMPGPPAHRKDSRSSSKVRFQDDVDFETRSNASTSSRPIGERWGGYEIPKPEKDLGKEVLYQITQQGFNELLNPLFQEKEDNAMDAAATRSERRNLSSEISDVFEKFKDEESFNKAMFHMGIFGYTKWVLRSITGAKEPMRKLLEDIQTSKLGRDEIETRLRDMLSSAEKTAQALAGDLRRDWLEEPEPLDLWKAMLCRMQLRREIIDGFFELVIGQGWLSSPTSPTTSVFAEVHDHTYQKEESLPYRDPTMPQFRPNSLADEQLASETAHSESESDESVTSSMLDVTRDEFNDVTYIHYTHRRGPFFIIPAHGFDSATPRERSNEQSLASTPQEAAAEAVHNSRLLQTGLQPSPDNFESESRPIPSPPPHMAADLEEAAMDIPSPSTLDPDFSNEPSIYLMWISSDNIRLVTDSRPTSHCMPWEKENTQKPLEQKIRSEALKKDSPLHLTFLASLEAVEEELRERNGSGLLSYKEFEEILHANGRLRFLEAWMDWVSF